jgi:hypothetical protein
MIEKSIEKQRAIALRKQGKTYSEILKVVPVVKSTISLWFKEVSLSNGQKQTLTAKKLASAKRGGLAKKKHRIAKSNFIIDAAKNEIGNISDRELFLIGTALYWAEGSKQKEHNISQPLSFGNSDPYMIQCFLRWLDILNVPKEEIVFELYIHTSGNVQKSLRFWSKIVSISPSVLSERVYFKKGNPKTIRRNVGEKYNGLLRLSVKKSTDLNRKVSGWTQGIIKNYI